MRQKSENPEPEDFVAIAVECSHYITPLTPGLDETTIYRLGESFGLLKGELRNGIDKVERDQRIEKLSGNRFVLTPLRSPYLASQASLTWPGDPRSPTVDAALSEIFDMHRREHGEEKTRILRQLIVEAAERKGLSTTDIDLHLELFRLYGFLQFVSDDLLITGRGQGYFKNRSPRERAMSVYRPFFEEISRAVRGATMMIANDAASVSCKIFISHKREDKDLAEALVQFLEGVLRFDSPRQILCTSVVNHEIEIGANEEAAIRRALNQAKVVIALLTENSKGAVYVLMELGAAWILGKQFVPLLCGPVRFSDIPDWVKTQAVHLSESAECEREFAARISGLPVKLAAWTDLRPKDLGEIAAAVATFRAKVKTLVVAA